jgi:hypothetical protein
MRVYSVGFRTAVYRQRLHPLSREAVDSIPGVGMMRYLVV